MQSIHYALKPAAARYAVVFLVFALFSSLSHARFGLPDFTELVEEHTPAVVIISTTQKVSGIPGHQLRGQIPEYFRYFFGDGFEMPEQEREGLGSGIILSRDGYILTNNHVVAGADEISIRLSDRRVLDAKLIGGDELSDLALLKVDADDLPVATLGNSDKLKIGEWVLAIGSPFGFEHSVTAGIVSAKGRNLSNDNYVPFIQTDAAINPGNSGGPLFNLDGEVVGINSQIYSRSGGFMGLSFAIPINVAMEVVEQLKDKGQVSRGWLGVVIHDVSRDLALSLGLSKPEGAIVAKVLPGGPADEGGIKAGDVIREFAGKPITKAANLRHAVGRTPPGTEVDVEVVRSGDDKTLSFKIGALPQDPALVASADPKPSGKTTLLGMEVVNLPKPQAQQLGIPGGVVVKSVEGKAAREAGIRPGDVVTNLANQEVTDVSSFRQIAKGLEKGKWVPILVNRRGAPEFLAIKVE
ncbi:MAG: DegQ family serine endoprotease [Ketobacteraceae bacterium]|nr:DegQ family serine endoprotease [Ketobacteraceae bacterium]